ncbi:MAG TPA: ribosome silencing factor [Steroidobacteraceae bacterium]|nr:ribosome silencing factor [Steroidobacteraceae bacterium]
MTTRTKSRRSAERVSPLQAIVTAALDDMKAVNVKVLDVRGLTDIADTMVIASGNSDRHVRSIADNVVQKAKEAGYRPLGTEGARDGEWVLVDLTDILVHVMLPRVREFYGLERLWDAGEALPPVDAKPAPKAVPAAEGATYTSHGRGHEGEESRDDERATRAQDGPKPAKNHRSTARRPAVRRQRSSSL